MQTTPPTRMTRKELLLLLPCIILFSTAALFTGTPGADWNAPNIYDVTTELAHTFRYTLSRTPGQPFLDYLNFVFSSLAGLFGLHAWFVVVSSLGVLALFRLLRYAGGPSPLIGAATLALNPLFLAHVGGLGDFAVSSSFLLISLSCAIRGNGVIAGICLALATGCRLVFGIYVIPLMALIALSARAKGATDRDVFRSMLQGALTAILISALFYAPLLAFFGTHLLENLPFQTLRYHASAFLFKLLIGLGIPVWLVVAVTSAKMLQNWRRKSTNSLNHALSIAALLIAACCSLILFRVPTKVELALPILIAIILLVQFFAGRSWSYFLLIASVLSGLFIAAPYDRDRDLYAWHIEKGWYAKELVEAHRNSQHLGDLHASLARMPTRTLLVTGKTWTSEQATKFTLQDIQQIGPVSSLTAVTWFPDLGPERIVVDIHEPRLRQLIVYLTSCAPENRMAVYYEPEYLGLLRRWNNFDLSRYGHEFVLANTNFFDTR